MRIFRLKNQALRTGRNDRETGGETDLFGEEKSGDAESCADAKLMQKLQTPQNPNKSMERAKGFEPSTFTLAT
jgi:hypothetical protein